MKRIQRLFSLFLIVSIFAGSPVRADLSRELEADSAKHGSLFDGNRPSTASYAAAKEPPLDDWIKQEEAVAAAKMLANISPAGSAPGSVAASPSKKNPDYFYHWIRDAGLTMTAVVGLYSHAATEQDQQKYLGMLQDYAAFSIQNQRAKTLTGLGEPKFNMDGTPFDDPWGRPQNDGPAIRAAAMIEFARLMLETGRPDYVRRTLYDGKLPSTSLIKTDLEFVAHHWQEPSFDLWEEIKGRHFYTKMVQRKALLEGSRLAGLLGDSGAADYYALQARGLSAAIEKHWNASKGIIVPTLNRVDGVDYKKSGLDSSIILAVLHGSTDDGFFGPTDDRVLATAAKLEDAFLAQYPINKNPAIPGIAIGRYPEDRYNGSNDFNGGNPWALLTAGMAEFYYRAATDFEKTGKIKITRTNLRFFENRGPALKEGEEIDSSDEKFTKLVSNLRRTGDHYMARVRRHANPDGSLSEQIQRETGLMTSAKDLTWSYAAFLTAAWTRSR